MKTSFFRPFLSLVALSVFYFPTHSRSCDICGCYTPNQELNSDPLHSRDGGFYAASAEQYTFFGTTQFSGKEVPNAADQFEHSSITQIIAGYNFNSRLGAQVNVPLIYRDYKRPEGFTNERGEESGLGDVSLLFNFIAYRTSKNFSETHVSAASGKDAKDGKNAMSNSGEAMNQFDPQPKDFSFTLNLIAGAKFPTGDPSRIKEEFSEVEVEGAAPSGIHGHDLALGSGSYDAVLGAGIFTRYKAGFFQADVQYAVRTTGSYDYRYANDLSFDFGPGYFLLQSRRVGGLGLVTLGAQCVVTGEHKNRDTFRGKIAEDTGVTALYVGPRVLAGVGSRFIAEIGADLPVLMDNTSFQVVPDYRVRAGFSYHF